MTMLRQGATSGYTGVMTETGYQGETVMSATTYKGYEITTDDDGVVTVHAPYLSLLPRESRWTTVAAAKATIDIKEAE